MCLSISRRRSSRDEYEELIEPLVAKTLKCVDDAMNDAKVQANQISKVLLVGGATRTPLVQRLAGRDDWAGPSIPKSSRIWQWRWERPFRAELIAGIDVGPGARRHYSAHAGNFHARRSRRLSFAPLFLTDHSAKHATARDANRDLYDGVTTARQQPRSRCFRARETDTRYNTSVGEITIQGLADVPAPNDLLVRLDLDLSGILRVTATERATGLAKQVVIDNMMERFRKRERVNAIERLEALFSGPKPELTR